MCNDFVLYYNMVWNEIKLWQWVNISSFPTYQLTKTTEFDENGENYKRTALSYIGPTVVNVLCGGTRSDFLQNTNGWLLHTIFAKWGDALVICSVRHWFVTSYRAAFGKNKNRCIFEGIYLVTDTYSVIYLDKNSQQM